MRTQSICLALAIVLNCPVASAQWLQQGSKLVGTGAYGFAQQGSSVAISSDGNTAIVGGHADSNDAGAAWLFTRSGETWTQQGGKLRGTGAVNAPFSFGASQGSVSLSSDGNTAIVGGPADSNDAGAVWVFIRSGGVWTQQGGKLVGSGAVGYVAARQGASVSLSADGNTAIVGGPLDSNYAGAAWVFTRSGGVWTQQGGKLRGTGVADQAAQGMSVALSSDGNTAIVGGPLDNNVTGAAWVFTRSGGVWTQQGNKLVGTGSVGEAEQGWSVSLSSDGNTAIVGGFQDDSYVGAAWVFTRSGGVWTQQGAKLVGSDTVGKASQGGSVSLSSDGNTAIVGGRGDSSGVGAAWVFTRTGGVWTQLGTKLRGADVVGRAQQGSVALSSDGNTAIVGGWDDNSEAGAAWVYTRSGTGIEERAVGIPQQFDLRQNYPNPFNPSTTIKFELPKASHVSLTVYDILGCEVSVLVNDRKDAGVYEVKFDGSNLASGVYFYRLQAGDYISTKRLLLLK